MKKRAMVVMICAICFVASFVTAGCIGLSGTGAMGRMLVSQSKELVIGVNQELAPMAYMDKTGSFTGFDIDVADAACKRMGVQPKFVVVPAQQEQTYLQKGKISCYWSAYPKEKELTNELVSSDAYYKSDQVILYLTGQPFRNLVDLKGTAVAVRQNSSAKHVLSQSQIFRNSLGSVIEVETNKHAIEQLEQNKVQAIVLDKETAMYYQKQQPGRYSILTKNDGSVQVVGTGQYVVLFAQGNEKEVNFIKETIDQIEDDGTIHQLANRWFVSS